MFTNFDVLETIQMVEKEHLDIRTITMGLSLLSCIRDSAEETAQKVYDYFNTTSTQGENNDYKR